MRKRRNYKLCRYFRRSRRSRDVPRGFDSNLGQPSINPAIGSPGERCELPQRGSGQDPGRKHILRISISKTASGGDVFGCFCGTFPGSGWWGWGFDRTRRTLLGFGSALLHTHTHTHTHFWQAGGWINMKHNINKNNIIIQRNYIW